MIDKNRTELEKLQSKRFKKIIRHVYQKSPFYKKKFKESNIDPNNITLEKITKLPFTTKDDIYYQGIDKFLCVKQPEIIDIRSTSGTTGKRLFLPFTRNDVKEDVRFVKQELKRMGVTKKDVAQMTLYSNNLSLAGDRLVIALRSIGVAMLEIGPEPISVQLDLIKRFKTTLFLANPFSLLEIGKFYKKNELGSVKRLFSAGYSIYKRNFERTPLAKKIEDLWSAPIYSLYGTVEMGHGTQECIYQKGVHLPEEYIFFEVINPRTGESVEDGKIGELVMTRLTAEACPLIRFRIGDLTFIEKDSCECGSIMARMGPVLGRVGDYVKGKSGYIYQADIENVLNEVKIYDYVILVNKKSKSKFRIMIPEEHKVKLNMLKDLFKKELGVLPTIKLSTIDEIKAIRDIGKKRRIFIYTG